MDVLLILRNRKHQAPIHLISPRAALPPRQAAWQPQNAVDWPELTSAAAFSRFIRAHLADDDWHSARWQESFESLRGGISAAWQALADSRKTAASGQIWQLVANGALSCRPADFRCRRRHADIRPAQAYRRPCQQHPPAAGRFAIDLGDRVQHADQVILAIGAGRDMLMMRLAADGILHGDNPGTPVDQRLQVTGDDCSRLTGFMPWGRRQRSVAAISSVPPVSVVKHVYWRKHSWKMQHDRRDQTVLGDKVP